MKKIYINPNIEVVELEGEELMEIASVGISGQSVDNVSAGAKERNTVDFSDDESIW